MNTIQEEFEKLSIINVARGAAVELFGHALGEVLANIMDENRNPQESRQITLTFDFKSNRERNQAIVAVQSKVKLAPVEAVDATMYMRTERGTAVAYSHNVFQPELPFDGPQVIRADDRATQKYK